MRKGTFYDDDPMQMGQLGRMLAADGFRYRNLCIEAWRATSEIERPDSFGRRMLEATPDALLKPLRRIIPTLIYRIESTRS